MVPLTPSVMCSRTSNVWRTRNAGTLSQIYVVSLSGRSSFSGSFRCSFFRCKIHCNVFGGIRLRDCAFLRRSMCSQLHGVPCCILFGFPSALQQVYVSGEDCARGARSELYVFSRLRSNSFQRFSPSSFYHVRLLPRCLLPHRCLVSESDHARKSRRDVSSVPLYILSVDC